MAKIGNSNDARKRVKKTTCQGGSSPKTSSMSKARKSSFKAYRGQGR